jgi:transcriptional regulator with XRE-family HTH domain
MTEKERLNMEVAKRLKQSMDEKKMKATELSEVSGIGKSDISNYLKGKYRPKQEKLFLLALALDVDPVWLGAIDLQMQTNEKSAQQATTDTNDATHDVISRLSPEGQKKVREYALLVELSEHMSE